VISWDVGTFFGEFPVSPNMARETSYKQYLKGEKPWVCWIARGYKLCQLIVYPSGFCWNKMEHWNIHNEDEWESHGFPYRYHIETTISINLPDTKECFRTICDGEIHGKSWQQLHTATPDLKLHVFSLDAQGKLGSLRLKNLNPSI
jgi:hypothetical protein